MSCRKVISEHLKTVGNTDDEAEIDLISDRAPILNTLYSNQTRSPVPSISVFFKALDEEEGHKDDMHSRRVIQPC